MEITRRDFLKLSGGATGFLLASPLFGKVGIPKAYANVGPEVGTETTTICCFCACGCGAIVTASGGKVVNVEGDPTHPINEGALCSKGQAQYQTANQLLTDAELSPAYDEGTLFGTPGSWPVSDAYWPKGKRLARCLYRAPNSTQWEVKNWTWMLTVMAKRIYDTRKLGGNSGGSFEHHNGYMEVNRSQAIAALGGAAHDNQECYLMRKLWTGLGLVYIEHQARI